MRKKLLAVMVIAAGSVFATTASVLVAPAAHAQAKVSNKVGVPLKAAQDAANRGRYADALAKLREADAVTAKTAFDQFQINEVYGQVYLKQRNYNGAASIYEKSLNAGELPASQINDRIKTLAQLYFQTQPRNLKKVVEYCNRYLKATGSRDSGMYFLLGQAYYLGGNYKAAVASIRTAVKNAESAGQPIPQNWLHYLLDSYTKLNDANGVTQTTTSLVQLYPHPDNWRRLTGSLKRQAANDDRVTLHVYRLMYELELLNRAEDYSEAAIVAIQSELPGEALKIMDRGYATKILSTTGDTARNQRILADARKQVAAQQDSLARLEQAAIASKQGDAEVRAGDVLLSYGQTEKAIAAAKRAIAEGTTNPDDAYLLLGRAYVQAKNGVEARKAFGQVKGQDVIQIARLWAIHASQI